MVQAVKCIALRTVKVADSRNLLSVWTAGDGRLSFAVAAGHGREAARRRALMSPLATFEAVADIRPQRAIHTLRDVAPCRTPSPSLLRPSRRPTHSFSPTRSTSSCASRPPTKTSPTSSSTPWHTSPPPKVPQRQISTHRSSITSHISWAYRPTSRVKARCSTSAAAVSPRRLRSIPTMSPATIATPSAPSRECPSATAACSVYPVPTVLVLSTPSFAITPYISRPSTPSRASR